MCISREENSFGNSITRRVRRWFYTSHSNASMFKLCLVWRISGDDRAVNFLVGWTRFLISSFSFFGENDEDAFFFVDPVERMVFVPERPGWCCKWDGGGVAWGVLFEVLLLLLLLLLSTFSNALSNLAHLSFNSASSFCIKSFSISFCSFSTT